MIRFGNEEFVDREELSTKEFWDRVITGPDMPSTAAPSPGLFKKAFTDAADSGSDGVVCVTLSSKLSATYQSGGATRHGRDRRQTSIPVRIVDSLSVTLGQGLLVLAAADMAADGQQCLDAIAAAHRRRARAHARLRGAREPRPPEKRWAHRWRRPPDGVAVVDQAGHRRARRGGGGGVEATHPFPGTAVPTASTRPTRRRAARASRRRERGRPRFRHRTWSSPWCPTPRLDHRAGGGRAWPRRRRHAGPGTVGVCFITKPR